jgi:hypothetical protein
MVATGSPITTARTRSMRSTPPLVAPQTRRGGGLTQQRVTPVDISEQGTQAVFKLAAVRAASGERVIASPSHHHHHHHRQQRTLLLPRSKTSGRVPPQLQRQLGGCSKRVTACLSVMRVTRQACSSPLRRGPYPHPHILKPTLKRNLSHTHTHLPATSAVTSTDRTRLPARLHRRD